jgi:hypothetical protein
MSLRVIQGLDEFLWVEEITELEVAADFYHSLASSIGRDLPEDVLRFALESLKNDHERWNSYSLVLSIGHVIFHAAASGRSAEEVSRHFERAIGICRELDIVRVLTHHLTRLLEVEVQGKLVRDISTHSLSRSLSESSTSTQVQVLESSIVSSEFRICLNVLSAYLLVSWESIEASDMRELLNVLLRAMTTQSHSDTVPVRKSLLIIFKILQKISEISDTKLHISPNNISLLSKGGSESSSMSLLVLQSFPLTIPRLKDFRSLVTLSYHQKSLIESPISPRPFAIVEAIDIIDRYILSFVKTYQFHELEIEYMKSNLDFMGRTFRVFLRNNLSKNILKNLFKPPQESRL